MERLAAHSFFVTPTWARVLDEAGMGFQCTALLGTDGAAEILLPLARKKGPLGTLAFRSMPWGTYGGPLVAGETSDAPLALAAHLRQTLGMGWFLATPGPWEHVAIGSPFATYSTQVIDLSGGRDELWKGLDKDARNQVRQAERAGVEVTVDNSPSAFDDYYSMLEASARRWGRTDPGKPRSLFRAIARLGTEATTRLWLARVGGRPAAGALCFYGDTEVFYWSGAMHAEHSRSRANNLIQWCVIEHASKQGFATYNMGASGELEGVRRFKSGFGSRPQDYPAYFIGTGPFRLAPALLRLRRAARR
jgi:CelD/BcsL family acetyltransferase involved in cellulose biosynthesis